MITVPPQTDNVTQLAAAEFNPIPREVENAIKAQGITLDETGVNVSQLAQTISEAVAVNNLYQDSGSANIYVLSPIGQRKAITKYSDGMILRFEPSNNNSGASTVNVASLGAKKLYFDGAEMTGGEILTGSIYFIEYDDSLDGAAGGFKMSIYVNTSNIASYVESSPIGTSDVFLRPSQSQLESLGNGAIAPRPIPADYSAVRHWSSNWGTETFVTQLAATEAGGYTWDNGSIFHEVDVDDSFTALLADVTFHIKKTDGSLYWVKNGDAGITITNTANMLKCVIDQTWSGIREGGFVGERGVFGFKNSNTVERDARGGHLLAESANGFAEVRPDGSTSQSLKFNLSSGATYSLPAPVSSIATGNASIVASHIGSATFINSYLVTVNFETTTTFSARVWRVDTGAAVSSATVSIQVSSK